MSQFWTGGAEAYENGLRQEYASRLASLRQRLATAITAEEEQGIAREIQDQKRELRAKLSQMRRSLF